MTAPNDSSWKYLRYVTVADAWRELWAGILAWAILTALFMAFAALGKVGVEATESWWSGIPKPVLYFAAFAAFTWFTRGESISVAVPESVKGWALLNASVLFFGLAAAFLPGWCFIPVYTAGIFAITTHETLAGIGQRNYERLHPESVGGA